MSVDATLLVQALVVAMPAIWLGIGVFDNIRYPEINRDDVARVLALDALNDNPDIRAKVAQRAVTDERLIRGLFVLIVVAEFAATVLMLAGSICLFGALLGHVAPEYARLLALAGVVGFTGIWAGFLIGGQWYYYWYASLGKTTHLLALLWGLAVILILLA